MIHTWFLFYIYFTQIKYLFLIILLVCVTLYNVFFLLFYPISFIFYPVSFMCVSISITI
jgi:hypothetical protein